MKRIGLTSKLMAMTIFLSALTPQLLCAQTDASSLCTTKQAHRWTKQRTWANGFKPMPHYSTNQVEFMTQYQKNKAVWDKTFQWLASHDLAHMPAGRYEIDGEQVFVNVQDAVTQEAANRKIEAHRHGIDLQYVVSGTERFGLTSAKYATPISAYTPDVTFYESSCVTYVDSTPACFFLFFPGNYHQALLKAGEKAEKVRVIVAKIAYLP